MPLNWEDVIRDGDPYEVSDFRNAAYQLLTSQIIYENGHNQGVAYRLIDRYRESFKEAFDLLGLSLKFDPDYRFIAAIPTAEKQPAMRLVDGKRVALPRSLTESVGVEVPRAAAKANRSGC